MMRHYGAQLCRGGDNPLRVGVIALGAIYYLQPGSYLRQHAQGRDGKGPSSAPVCRDPWQVLWFLNGTMGASCRDPDTGKWETKYRSGRTDFAMCRSLRDGRQWAINVRTLVLHEELGLGMGINPYPTLPDMRLYRCRHRSLTAPAPGLGRAA